MCPCPESPQIAPNLIGNQTLRHKIRGIFPYVLTYRGKISPDRGFPYLL